MNFDRTGTLTFLFTDIVDSSRQWDEHPEPMRRALVVHNEAIRGAVAEHRGEIVKDRGDGFLAVFAAADDAIAAAIDVQRRLTAAPWEPAVDPLRVRIGMHTGTAEARDGDYFGPEVNRAARLEAAAHGGQVLISEATRALSQEALPEGAVLHDLGYHTLRGLTRPERVYQLTAPGLLDDFPSLQIGAGRFSGFPAFATSFVGRADDVSALGDLLRRGETRAVTVLGPGGMGKTRLSVEVARAIAPEFAGGASFVDLAPVAEPEGIPFAIAEAIGVHPEGAAEVMDLVASTISSPTLLVLDNFEQVTAGSPLVADLVSRCPQVKVLVTSRTPLRIRGEVIHQLEPLGVGASNGEAFQLFVDRAAGLGVNIDTGGEEAEAVSSIVARLDGLPLAIELAAARVRVLAVIELDRRLGESIKVVGRGAADLPERQQTLQSTIDWSVDSLSDTERAVFYRLSVFPAGATMDQLEQVAAAGLDGEALDLISTLVDNSLAHVVTDLPGGTRFRQLAVLREYAADHLAGDREATMGRLVDYYTKLVDAPERIHQDLSLFFTLEVDFPNLESAMEWSLGGGRAADMVRVLFMAWPLWFNGDRIGDAAAWTRRVGEQIDSPELDWLQGFFGFQTGDYVTAAGRLEQALDRFSVAGDPVGVALSKTFAGALTSDHAEAHRMLDEAADYFDANDLPVGGYVARLFSSLKIAEAGELERSLEMRYELLPVAEALGYDVLVAWAHWNIATVLIAMGRDSETGPHVKEAFATMAAHRYQEGMASTSEMFAILAGRAGDSSRAVLIHGACAAIWDRLGVRVWWEIVPFIADTQSAARAEIGDTEYERLLAEGRSMSLDELIEFVDRG